MVRFRGALPVERFTCFIVLRGSGRSGFCWGICDDNLQSSFRTFWWGDRQLYGLIHRYKRGFIPSLFHTFLLIPLHFVLSFFSPLLLNLLPFFLSLFFSWLPLGLQSFCSFFFSSFSWSFPRLRSFGFFIFSSIFSLFFA